MFKTIKNWLFNSEQEPLGMTATITELSNGRFGLINRRGEIVKTYSRARDAKRGAARNGLILA